jgi:hypothetical protein
MALIPPDAAIRLRMETDRSLQAIAPLKELSSELGNLVPGQTFTARIQQATPENNYRALVGGKEILLSLPDTAKAGDTLQLVVVEKTAGLVVAQMANPADGSAAQPQAAELSPAAQMIGKLLLPSGQQPEPALLNKGEPLIAAPLPAPSDMAAALTPQLAKAATQSGLFYESHQALWLSGQHSTEALRQEPQAQHAATRQILPAVVATPPPVTQKADKALAVAQIPASDSQTLLLKTDVLQAIPDDLRPLVQQQLDAAATQRVAWHGEVWPGQTMQWQISRDSNPQGQTSDDEASQWTTSLALTTPQMGRVEATINLSRNSVNIKLAADSAGSASALNARLSALASALDAAGLKPTLLQVRHGKP